MSDDDVHLDRRFLELKSGEEDDVPRDLPLFHLRDVVPWERVLEERCAVILGESGTGKTTEFRLRRKLLAESGRPAFFLAVEELATKQVTALLDSDEEQRFSAWGSAETIAYFFLDAVDEARLRSAKSLPSALRNLERDLRGKLARSRVLISCRVSDWRAQSDRGAIQSILLKGDVEEVKVFALAPLVDEQVVLLAKHYRVGDVEAFIREIRRVGAYSYLERPGDVAWLVGHWREQGTIATYTQLIASDVDRKLRESNPDRRPSLSPAKAELAATALAGLATLQRKASFVIPDGEIDPARAATSLDPEAVLPDLTRGEIAELLTLPLFDAATYGRVRIHHRSVSEYLTARWLWSLMQRGLDPSEVERLLFQQTPSGPALPPELVQVAAWLAAESPVIRDRVMAVAPLALLEGGDPNSLPDETRREVLLKLAGQYEGRERLFRSFDRVALRRLATSNLAQTINELLLAPDQPAELITTLLRIVIEGNLEACAGTVTGIAVDLARPAPVREDAIEAVAKVGAPANKEAVVRALLGEQDVDQQIGGAAVDLLFPSPLDILRLLELLRRSAKPPPDKTGSLARVLGSRVYERTPDADRARLLSDILDLVQDPAAGQARRWLLAPFARLVVAYASTCDDEVGRRSLGFLDELARGLTFETGYDLSRGADKLRALLGGRPDLRRFLFWEQAARPLPNGRGRPTRYRELPSGHAPLWSLSSEDLDWLEHDALLREHIPERLLAFDSFMSVQVPDERAEEVRARSERLAASNLALRTRFERRAKRSRYVHPEEARWARRKQVRENRQHRDHAANLAWLREHLEEIRSGESQAALIWLWHRAPSSDEEESEVIIRKLTDQLDAEIAQAAEEGWRRSWRTVECPLPHEKAERNVVSNTAMIGLAGISVDLWQGLDLASLSADAATQAARLATHVMNRFPSWIEPLVRHHGLCVQAVFGTCIRADYAAPAQHDVLGLLAHAPQPVQEVCAPVLEELIQAGDPADTRVLEQVLEVLLSLAARRAVLARLAPERCAGDTSDLTRFALWWAVWFAADPDAAVESLATRVAADGDRAGDRVLAVCEQIWSWLERDQQVGFGLPEQARALTSFLAIVLTYVHPSGDVRHIGAHYLGTRDHAEWLRGLLIQRLAAIPGQGTVDGLVQLANDVRWPEWRDWLLSLAERRLTDDLTLAANDVAAKLLKAYQTHGLVVPEHLAEAGLRTVSMTAGREQSILTAYRYRDEARGGLRLLNEAKLVVLGNEAVGKTSLIRYLVHDRPRDPDEKRPPGAAILEKIEVSAWSMYQSQVRLNIWDFSAQEIMRGTHWFFLTERSLYLLVLEDRREDDRSIHEWLELISQRGGDSPVIVVINKSDGDIPQRQVDEAGLQRAYPVIAGFVRTSCSVGLAAAVSIARLRELIAATLSESPRLRHVRAPIPQPWLRVKDEVAALARKRSFLSIRDFERLCEGDETMRASDRITDFDEQRAVLALLHDLGAVVAYGLRDDAPAVRREITVLNPNWLTGAFYALINSPTVRDRGGELRHDKLGELLDLRWYPPRWHEFILSMMQEPALGLCLPIADGPLPRYLLPDALPVNEPDYSAWQQDALWFRLQYNLLPIGLIARFIVEVLRHVTDKPTWWRTGVVFKAEGCSILVRGDAIHNRIEIQVVGAGAQRAALGRVRSYFDVVHRHYARLAVRERVPLPEQMEADVDYELLVLLEREKGLDHTFLPEDAHRKYSVRELLEGVRSDEARRRRRSPYQSKIDFAILTIREDENGAILRRFAKVGTEERRRRYRIRNLALPGGGAYTLAVLRCMEQGNLDAQVAANDLLEDLAPRFVLVVGIAGAIPSYEFTLGDVVVSSRIVDFSVEAVIRDKEREYALAGGPLHLEAARLAADIGAMSVDGELDGWNSPDAITQPRPPVDLHDARFYGDEEWRVWVRDRMRRHFADRAPRPPLAISGAIASSDLLIKGHEVLSVGLKIARQIVAIEMESAGIYRVAQRYNVPFLAIRGISDIFGYMRDPDWTAYACETAAAFTRAFLRTRPIEPIERG